MLQKATNITMTFCFCFLQVGSNFFLFLEWVLKKALWKNYRDNLEKSCRSWKRRKKDWESNINLQTFCFYSLGLQTKVCLFLLLWNLFQDPNLKKLLKQLEKTNEIVRKHWGDITLKSLEDKQVLASKSILFLFQILKMTTRRTICNNNNNHHYIKRSIFKNKFQKKFIFPMRSAQRKQVDN